MRINIKLGKGSLKSNLPISFVIAYAIKKHITAERIHELKRTKRDFENKALKNIPIPVIEPTAVMLVDRGTFIKFARRMQRKVESKIVTLIW
jgi:hypothetical protein